MKSIYKIIILAAILMVACPMMAQGGGDSASSQDSIAVDGGNGSAAAMPAVESLDQAADEAYMRGGENDYKEAIRLYKAAIERDGSSAAIYYNLGNAYYRVDSLAKAIIYYERALRLDPTDEDARANLEFVNSKIIDARPADGISNILVEKTMLMLSPNGWAILSIVIFVIVLLLAAGYIFSRNIRNRKVYFFAAIVVLLINIVSIVISINAASVVTGNKEAIVVVESTQLSTSPATPLNESQKAMLLHEGSKVKVIRELSTPLDPRVKKWVEVEAAGDNRAWIDAEAIEVI